MHLENAKKMKIYKLFDLVISKDKIQELFHAFARKKMTDVKYDNFASQK